MAINSDALQGTMEVHAAIRQHRDKVPGLNVIAEEMAEFFPGLTKKPQQQPKRKSPDNINEPFDFGAPEQRSSD